MNTPLEFDLEVARLKAMFRRKDDRRFLQEPELPSGFDRLAEIKQIPYPCPQRRREDRMKATDAEITRTAPDWFKGAT